MSKPIGIGVIGMGWMGELHARSYQQVPVRFPDAPLTPELVICADEFEKRALGSQAKYGFGTAATNWRDVIGNDAVDVVHITTPNNLHLEIATAAAEAGKHVFCEKPVGRNPGETAQIAAAVREAGVNSHVGFNYRWVPVVQKAKQIIDEGRIGDITHYRGQFLEGYGANPNAMLTWRFAEEESGLGALGDIMSHTVDMAHMLAGPVTRVVSQKETFIKERPAAVPGEGTHYSIGAGGPLEKVSNEDYVGALVQFESGARGSFEVCRVVVGEKLGLRFQINGTTGAMHWSLERMNELDLYLLETEDPVRDGYINLRSGPEMPHHANFNPAQGLQISYDDLKVIEMYEFLRAIAEDRPSVPGLAEAVAVGAVAEAMRRSWESGHWEAVTPI